MRTTTLTIAFATAVAIAATAPVLAASQMDSSHARATQVRHSMTLRHQHHAALQTRENATMSRGNFANANASANTPVKDESMASQLARTVTMPGNASSPVCQPGSLTPLDDGRMHPCQ